MEDEDCGDSESQIISNPVLKEHIDAAVDYCLPLRFNKRILMVSPFCINSNSSMLVLLQCGKSYCFPCFNIYYYFITKKQGENSLQINARIYTL